MGKIGFILATIIAVVLDYYGLLTFDSLGSAIVGALLLAFLLIGIDTFSPL